jgi:hypothetical protein
LGLDPIRVILFVGQNRFEQRPRPIVAELDRQPDAVVACFDRAILGCLVVVQLRLDFAADVQLIQLSDDRPAFQKDDSADQFFGMLHLGDGSFLDRKVRKCPL